jgi:hypothetical protein
MGAMRMGSEGSLPVVKSEQAEPLDSVDLPSTSTPGPDPVSPLAVHHPLITVTRRFPWTMDPLKSYGHLPGLSAVLLPRRRTSHQIRYYHSVL